jgi:hypothetical protein
MANPGPASTVSNSPFNLSTNQALRLIASAQSVNLNAVADTIAAVLDSGRVSVQSIIVTNASVNLTTAQLAVYSGAAATGTAVLSASALTDCTGSSVVKIFTASSTAALTTTPLYIRCTTAQGAAATADVFIYGYDLTFLP